MEKAVKPKGMAAKNWNAGDFEREQPTTAEDWNRPPEPVKESISVLIPGKITPELPKRALAKLAVFVSAPPTAKFCPGLGATPINPGKSSA